MSGYAAYYPSGWQPSTTLSCARPAPDSPTASALGYSLFFKFSVHVDDPSESLALIF